VNVYPSQIEHALMQVSRAAPHYLLVVRREGALDTLEVRVEATSEAAEEGADALENLARVVRQRVHDVIGLSVEATVLAPRALERSVGKAKRVEDRRGEGGSQR
jgi:phenylacetate-CoA ligase